MCLFIAAKLKERIFISQAAFVVVLRGERCLGSRGFRLHHATHRGEVPVTEHAHTPCPASSLVSVPFVADDEDKLNIDLSTD